MKGLRWSLVLVGAIFLFVVLGLVAFGLTGSARRVRRVNRADPALIKAIGAAEAGLPSYLAELQHPKAGQRFAVMGRFGTSGGDEYLWIKDPRYADGKLVGVLDQVPILARYRKGDVVSITKANVVDWLIRNGDGTTLGQFTSHEK
jgi:uncharacterized protein YegJ (DUF2314 family)